jgi:hypothetical protein
LVELVRRWYDDGTGGAFGGPMHSIEPVGFHVHEDTGQTAEGIVDMGDCDGRALHELVARLDELANDPDAKPTGIVLGRILVN